MSAILKDETATETPPEEGVGQRLRKAREALDLGRAEVAAGLYLSESIIAALENNDRDALPGPVFVQGYLRKYARLLEIPEEPLLQAYGHQTPPQKPRKQQNGPLAGAPIKPEISSNHTLVRLITWAIALGLLALVATWWQSGMPWPGEEPPHGAAPDTLPEPQPPEQDAAEILPIPQAVPDAPETPPVPAAPGGAETMASDRAPSSPATDAPSATGTTPTQGLALEKTLGGAIPLPAARPSPAAETEAEPQPETIAADDAAPMAPAGPVVIEFSDACWTEIRGANGSYKLLGNMQKGERHVLGGEPPYSILLGNSQAATLTIRGKVFDIQPHTRGNIARFTLRAEDLSTP